MKVDIKTEIERQKRLDAEYHEEPSAINLDIQNLLEGLGKPITHYPSKIASQSIDNSESNKMARLDGEINFLMFLKHLRLFLLKLIRQCP